jgi:hypothetical protein
MGSRVSSLQDVLYQPEPLDTVFFKLPGNVNLTLASAIGRILPIREGKILD